MRKLRMLTVVLGVLAAACERGRARDDVATADTLGQAETAERTTELLSPVRGVGLVVVEFGDVAARQASREDVRQYALIVAADHRGLITTLDSAARLRGATLSETPSGRELAHTARLAHAGLDALQPSEFDLAFIRAEVETHRQLLDHLDHELIPGATSADVRNLLQEIRATADAHLTRARQLLGDLLGEPVEPPPPGATQSAPRPLPDTTPPDTMRPPPDTAAAVLSAGPGRDAAN
jgi:predicted outer membrane protein